VLVDEELFVQLGTGFQDEDLQPRSVSSLAAKPPVAPEPTTIASYFV
jgi:hypothetical protein